MADGKEVANMISSAPSLPASSRGYIIPGPGRFTHVSSSLPLTAPPSLACTQLSSMVCVCVWCDVSVCGHDRPLYHSSTDSVLPACPHPLLMRLFLLYSVKHSLKGQRQAGRQVSIGTAVRAGPLGTADKETVCALHAQQCQICEGTATYQS